jgi:hypothetical protein
VTVERANEYAKASDLCLIGSQNLRKHTTGLTPSPASLQNRIRLARFLAPTVAFQEARHVYHDVPGLNTKSEKNAPRKDFEELSQRLADKCAMMLSIRVF